MRVHVLADNFVRHAAVSTMLTKHCALTSELLDRASIRERDLDAIVVAADLSIMDNISTLKAVSAKLTHVAATMRAPINIACSSPESPSTSD